MKFQIKVCGSKIRESSVGRKIRKQRQVMKWFKERGNTQDLVRSYLVQISGYLGSLSQIAGTGWVVTLG